MSTTTEVPIEPIREIVASDYEQLYYQSQEKIQELENVIKASRIKPVSEHPSKDAKPGMTDEKLRAQIGANAYGNLSRADKVAALGVDPSTVDEVFLRKCFGKSNSGVEAKELFNSNPLRYRVLKEVAKALNIYSN
jgi:hypothetical protein